MAKSGSVRVPEQHAYEHGKTTKQRNGVDFQLRTFSHPVNADVPVIRTRISLLLLTDIILTSFLRELFSTIEKRSFR
jgi:hypothetical protein